MKKYMFVVAATLGMMIGTGATAQQRQQNSRKAGERPTAEQMAKQKTDRMKAKLALSDEQAKQLYDYNLQQLQEMQAKHEQFMAAQKAKREQLEAARKVQQEKLAALRQAEADKMKSILNAEQFEKWQQLQQARRQGGERGQMRKGDPRKRPHGMKHGRKGFRGGKHGFRGEQADSCDKAARAGKFDKGGKHGKPGRHGKGGFRGKQQKGGTWKQQKSTDEAAAGTQNE